MNDTIAYPQCFIIRDNESEEAIWFVVIEDENDDFALLTYQSDYLNSKYTVEHTTLSEAETYNAFGLAPLGTCSEFVKWIDDEIHSDVMKVGNIIAESKCLSTDAYPSYYLVRKKANNAPICVYPIKSKEQNIELPISWWEKFNDVLFLHEVSRSTFEECIAVQRMFEYNSKELLDRVEELTKKGA